MKKIEKHLIALDLDGTLLQGFSTYDEETFAYLKLMPYICAANLVN